LVLVWKEREMSKLFRVVIVGLALMGLAVTATACGGGGTTDGGADASSD
jgi:hypothetical protein